MNLLTNSESSLISILKKWITTFDVTCLDKNVINDWRLNYGKLWIITSYEDALIRLQIWLFEVAKRIQWQILA